MTKAKKSNTAVLYFSLSPWEEARQKSFTSGKRFYKNFKIAGLLGNHTKRQIQKSGLPYFVFDEHNQKGANFGEKFVAAFESMLDKGYDYVIAVGNDTPRLESRHILMAANQLEGEASDIVLGPATDGGTWLMAFSRKSFNSEILNNLAWNSGDLLTSIFEQLGRSQEISLLETFDDLDTEEDLQKFLQHTNTNDFLYRLKKNIWALFELIQVEFYTYQDSRKSSDLNYHFLLRAPPA